jgi:D-glycero-D-manno-heptose 1,7-bisphosphate phosphatase
MDKAIFLDRDGTIIKLKEDKSSRKMEPVRTPDQIEFCAYAVDFMKAMQENGYKLFIVSNQPDIAKGKITSKDMMTIHNRFCEMIDEQGIKITNYYYCLHHNEGKHPRYSKLCNCRKPSPTFVFDAAERNEIDLNKSWFIGDRETDLQCGENANMNAIRLSDKITLKHAHQIIFGGM